MSTLTLDWFRARHAWFAALTASLINAVGTPLLLLIGRDVPGLPTWPILTSAAVGALAAALLLLRRYQASVTSSSTIFLLNNLTVVLCLWSVIPSFASAGAPWTPFQANKLGMLIVAALAPELFPGIVAIGAFAACALGRMHTVVAPSVVDEPTVLLIFTVIALVLLVLRVRGLKSEFTLAQARVDADAANELSRRLIAMRDLANTPLQTIEIGIALLQQRYPDASDVTDRVSRAIERMRGLRPLLDSNARLAVSTKRRE